MPKLATGLIFVVLLAACSRKDATAVEAPDCAARGCKPDASTEPTDSGTPPVKRDAGTAGRASDSGTPKPEAGAAAEGGKGGAAGEEAGGAGAAAGKDAQPPTQDDPPHDAGPTRPPLPDYTLEVDSPKDGDRLGDSVTLSGRAPAFMNVEVWDATHRKPPLAQVTPKADGAFSTTIDVSSLSRGTTTWTVYAWDSPPGQSFQHTDSVTLDLTISDASSSGGDGQPEPGMGYVPAGYQLIFSDEFDGSSLDKTKWNTLAPFGVQFFGDSHQKQAFIPEAVSLKDGVVSFTANKSNGSNTNKQPYSSGSITTNRTFTHGYFEARVKVPAGKGLWPAYWLTSSSRWPPEWDIFEIVDGTIFGYTHPVSGGKCSFVEGAAGKDSTYVIPNVYGVYHVYGFKWTASDLYWYVDGVLTEHFAVDAAAGANDPFWLNLSLQVGGDWPGDPNSSTPFPSQMDVDYVRVYQQ
ncbi:MAG TPA: family 16 glycosylhydrolase [Polyangiales bacterium]|nr:family 16 glycosylhydrolase [Polyangiales bacterium]